MDLKIPWGQVAPLAVNFANTGLMDLTVDIPKYHVGGPITIPPSGSDTLPLVIPCTSLGVPYMYNSEPYVSSNDPKVVPARTLKLRVACTGVVQRDRLLGKFCIEGPQTTGGFSPDSLSYSASFSGVAVSYWFTSQSACGIEIARQSFSCSAHISRAPDESFPPGWYEAISAKITDCHMAAVNAVLAQAAEVIRNTYNDPVEREARLGWLHVKYSHGFKKCCGGRPCDSVSLKIKRARANILEPF